MKGVQNVRVTSEVVLHLFSMFL